MVSTIDDAMAFVSERMVDGAQARLALARDHETLQNIIAAAQIVADASFKGYKVLTFGNGGSAADAMHLASGLVRFGNCPAFSLTADQTTLTAEANDRGWNEVFRSQIRAMGKDGDVAIGISTSGKSMNVLLGLYHAKVMGMWTIMLNGPEPLETDGSWAPDVEINTPGPNHHRIQENQVLIGHLIAEIVEAHNGR